MSKTTDLVKQFAEPVVKQFGCELWEVEYVKEAGNFFLRLYIDKEGGVSINDCENISRAMDPILDEKDPVQDSYIFEVSSAGAERQLRNASDFERFMGELVTVKLYKPKNGTKEYAGKLSSYENGNVEIEAASGKISFLKDEIASVRLRIE